MRWSLQLGSVRGIGIYVHVTFALLLAWVGWAFWQDEGTLLAVVQGLTFVILLFACIVLHELGHALTAARYGIPTRDITLLPIGGVARLERMPEDPAQELKVALAGPAVNVVIAVVLFLWLFVTGGVDEAFDLDLRFEALVAPLMKINLLLVAFNMLPAFPMDGGRVVRALLAMKLDYDRATRIAARIGQGMAVAFGVLALLGGNPWLILIAVFVWFGARQEAEIAHLKHVAGAIPVSRAMMTRFWTLAPSDSLARVVELVLAGAQHDFPVVEDGRVVGIVTRARLLQSLAGADQPETVVDVMDTEFPTARSDGNLADAAMRLQGQACPVMPVMRHGELVGLLTTENLGEFMVLQSSGALQPARRPPPLPNA